MFLFLSMLISQKSKSIQPDAAKNFNVKKNIVNIKHFSAISSKAPFSLWLEF